MVYIAGKIIISLKPGYKCGLDSHVGGKRGDVKPWVFGHSDGCMVLTGPGWKRSRSLPLFSLCTCVTGSHKNRRRNQPHIPDGRATKPTPLHTFLEHSRTLAVSDRQNGAEQSMGWKLQARWSGAEPDMSGPSCQGLIKRANQLSVL